METPTETFLDGSAFRGPSVTGRAVRGSFVGRAVFNGCIVFCHWPRERVEGLLPDDLELATNVSATPDLHPVVFVFGDQTRGSAAYGGFDLRFGVPYQEFALAVPFVRHERGRYLHTFLPGMISSYYPATWSGVFYYAYPKRMGTMGWEGPLYLVKDSEGRLLLHAQVEPAGEWSPGVAHADLARVRAVFSLPVLGRRAPHHYVSSYFDWDFADARVRPIDASISVDSPFVDGLDRGVHPDVASGSFQVDGMIWRLSWPGPSRL